ncbi:Ig-like domain-containing protein [Candidatus Saccharibacteria bacterium]|nr:Ig-like domain-containing protein [Candidatus Saccharibacteria bacterium]
MYQQNDNGLVKYIALGLVGVVLIGGVIAGIIFSLTSNQKSSVEIGAGSKSHIDVIDKSGGTIIDDDSDSGDVNQEEKTVELSESIINLEVGETKELFATVHPVDIDDEFTWRSMDENVATVADGVVTAVGAGSTNVVLSVNGISSISSTCTVNVVADADSDSPEDPDDPSEPTPDENIVYPERIYLSRGDQIISVGNTVTVTATIHPSNSTDKTITWTSSNNSVATVDDGQITGIKTGNATITAKTHNGKTASLVVTVKKNDSQIIPVSAVRLNQTSAKVKAGSSIKLTATVLPANATNKTISWSSNNTNVAVVDNGKVIGRSVGTAKITARSSNGKTATATITVEQGNVEVTGISLNKSSVSVNVGATTQLVATILPQSASNKKVTWTSSNTSVATVSNGIISGIKAGTATITAKTYNGKTAKATVTVNNVLPTSITLNTNKVALVEGSTYRLTATISPNNSTNKTITWSTSNAAVAKISGGTITAVKAGSATITAKTHNGKTATATITVTTKVIYVTGVSISPSSASIYVGSTKALVATLTPSNATTKAVTWTSSNTAVATVSATGVVTGKKAGTAKITVKTNNGKTATATITVNNVNATSITLNKTSASILVGNSVTLTATISPANTTIKTITWASSNTAVATVSGGKVTGKKAGTAKITAKTANGKTATATITVNNINVTSVKLNKTSATIIKGKTITLTATIAPTNATIKTLTWTSSNTAVATVSGGKVTAKAPGIVTITAKSHNGKTATAKITVMNFDRSVISSYGVFLGVDHDDGWSSSRLKQLFNYKLVVIDFQEFKKADIDKLHAKGIKVYTYLNIGSIENWRSYWKTYKKYALGDYEGWPGEKWIDVSKTAWQNYITGTLAPKLKNMGADGFFIDNADVYYHYKRDGIYKGLQTILKKVHSYGKPVLINGGDVFVKKAMGDNSYLNLFDGVNQEEVFTTNSYKTQSSSETKYLKSYLATVKAKNLKVYLLEYKANSSNLKKIKDYCSTNGFAYHNAKSKDLK